MIDFSIAFIAYSSPVPCSSTKWTLQHKKEWHLDKKAEHLWFKETDKILKYKTSDYSIKVDMWETWGLLRLLSVESIAGCRWIFIVKLNPNESVSKLMACLVIKDMHKCVAWITQSSSPIAKCILFICSFVHFTCSSISLALA